MQLYPDFSQAMDNGIKRYLRQSSDKPLYVLPASIARRKFFVVVSTEEANKYKLPIKTAAWEIGNSETAQQSRVAYRNHLPDKKTKTQIALIKNYRKFRKAQEKLDKMGRDAESVKRAHEVTSDSSPQTVPSSN